MADDVLAPDELVSDGVMIRHLKEGDYFYSVPKANLPTEPSDDLKTDPYATNFKPLSETPGLPVRRNNPMARPDEPGAPNYLMAPDLLETQQGQTLPTGIAVNDAGIPFNKETGAEIPTVSRPSVLPIAKTPDGYTLAMPKMLDLAGNIMGGVASVPAKAGEVVLGSGAVRKMADAPAVAAPFFSYLERAVDDAKIGKASADQWLGYLKNQPGVKSEELSTVLGDLKGNLTKVEVQDAVKNNKVELGEVVKGGESTQDKAFALAKEHGWKSWDEIDVATQNKYLARVAREEGNPPTKYHSYQLPGGENYKEMLLRLPENSERKQIMAKHTVNRLRLDKIQDEFDDLKLLEGLEQAPKDIREQRLKLAYEKTMLGQENAELAKKLDNAKNKDFKSSHWDEPNIVAHIRMNDRTVEGKKVLHLEELQSDWGQLIRKQGYKLDPKEKEILEAGAKSVDEKLIAAKRDDIMGNPDLKTGLDQAIKDKIITQKEADDYLKLTQNEHSTTPNMPFKKNWDELALKRMLHKAATEGYHGLSWTPGEAQAARYDLSKSINKVTYDPKYKVVHAEDLNGNQVIRKAAEPSELADIVGKEAAEKLLKSKVDSKGFHKLENADLKIGGEGMKTFYDKMLVDRANNLVKKYGSKVEQRELAPAFDIKIEKTGGGYTVTQNNKVMGEFDDMKSAKELEAELKQGKPGTASQPIHYLPITEELRARAKQGFPLFSTSPTLTAVSHDPFNSDNQKFKLTPVEYDPFK